MGAQMKQMQRAAFRRADSRTTARPAALAGDAAQRANAGPHAASLAQLRSVLTQRACADCEHVRRAMGGAEPAQRAAVNRNGLPDGLRAGLENLSGRDLSGVRVNYDSPRPAQLNAHAFAQGSTIHVAPGQERHLPHEGWHAVQQMQNRVRPTMSLGGTPVNDSAQLEREADVMGARALAEAGAAQLRATGKRGAGAASGGGVAQRKVDLDEFMTLEDRMNLFADQLDMDDLEDVQDLLGDRDLVAGLLGELEGEMNEQFKDPESEYKYTRALDMALFEQEAKWMPIDARKQREVIPGDVGVASNDRFLENVSSLLPLKDVGAAVSHGEYAHRLQWYMISRSMEKNLFEEQGGRFDPDAPRAKEFQYLLKTLYRHMGRKEYTKMLDKGVLRETSEKERNNPGKDQFPLPLWSAILDIPGSFTARKPYDDIYAAAPVKLTGALTFEGTSRETRKGDLQEGPLAYSQLSLAVLNRRIKRFLEKGREGDVVLANQLATLRKRDDKVDGYLGKLGDVDPLDYDRRNEIAFKLMGIPWVVS